jgi:hypothetical protein
MIPESVLAPEHRMAQCRQWPKILTRLLCAAILCGCLLTGWPVAKTIEPPETLTNPNQVFPDGEVLVYDVKWDPPAWMFFVPSLTAGQMTLICQKVPDFRNKPAYKFSVKAVSSGFLPKLTGLTVNDYFESIVEQDGFCSMQMYQKTQEGKRLREMTQQFNPGQTTGKLQLLDTGKNPPRTIKDETMNGLPPCVQDMVSALYHSRMRPLQVGGTYPVTICETSAPKTMEIRVTRRETLKTCLGTIPTLVVEGAAKPGVLFKDGGQLLIWATDDQRKIPVHYEIKVKMGRVFGDLLKVGSG